MNVPSASSTFKIVIVNRRSTRRLLNVAALQEQLLGLFVRPVPNVRRSDAAVNGNEEASNNKLCVMTNFKRGGGGGNNNTSVMVGSPDFQLQQEIVAALSNEDNDYLPPLDQLPSLAGTAPYYYKHQSSYPPPPRNCTTPQPPSTTSIPKVQFELDRVDMINRLWGGGVSENGNKLMPSTLAVSIEVIHMEDLQSRFGEPTSKPRGSLAEQAAIFHAADVLITVHGAAVAWSTSMRDGSTLIEIIPPWWGGPIIPVETSMYGAITFANRVHHHTISCGGTYTLASLKGRGGRAIGGYTGAIQANFNIGPLEMFQVLSLTTTAVRRAVSERKVHTHTNEAPLQPHD